MKDGQKLTVDRTIQIVPCAALKPKAFRPVEECKPCKFHRGIRQVPLGKFSTVDLFEVICAQPHAIRIESLDEGVKADAVTK